MKGYNFDFATSAKISPDVVKEMIKTVVEEQTGRKVSKIDVNMRTVTKGCYRNEYDEVILDGVTVHFEGESSSAKTR